MNIASDLADEILLQTNKRLTMNLLIQGAAAHSYITAHHLVKGELEAIRPGLTELYDRFAINAHLNYWIGEIPLFFGFPKRFWRRTRKRKHPFHRHPLLAQHGGELSAQSKRHLIERGKGKKVSGIPFVHYVQMIRVAFRTIYAERDHHEPLIDLAKLVTHEVWGIDESLLDAEITMNVAFGNLDRPKTWVGRFSQKNAAGYSGAVRDGERFKVVAKAWFFPLIVHELVKGSAELISLHGLHSLDDYVYEAATKEADQIEYEVWLLQAGPEMWRRLLAAVPKDRKLAEVVMHLARLEPLQLESLMLDVIEDPATARRQIERL